MTNSEHNLIMEALKTMRETNDADHKEIKEHMAHQNGDLSSVKLWVEKIKFGFWVVTVIITTAFTYFLLPMLEKWTKDAVAILK